MLQSCTQGISALCRTARWLRRIFRSEATAFLFDAAPERIATLNQRIVSYLKY
jgi:hypothetical protein